MSLASLLLLLPLPPLLPLPLAESLLLPALLPLSDSLSLSTYSLSSSLLLLLPPPPPSTSALDDEPTQDDNRLSMAATPAMRIEEAE
jgi:hypothetical protein